MSIQGFDDQVDAFSDYVDRLHQMIAELPEPQKDLFARAFHGFNIALEELRVAEEELRQQNEELLESQKKLDAERQRYQNLFEFAPDGYLVTDEDGVIEAANQSAAKLINLSQHLMAGKPLSIFIPNPERRLFGKWLSSLIQEKVRQEWELVIQQQDGRLIPVAVTAAAIRNQPNDRLKLHWMLHDISARTRARELLQRSISRVQLLQEIASKANASTNIEHVLKFAVKRICAHTGWPVGHVYLYHDQPEPVLLPTEIWHLDNPEKFETFRQATGRAPFAPGEGVSGRVLASQKPEWVADVTKEHGCARLSIPENCPVKAGLFFPVLANNEVAAVMEFFSEEALEPDLDLLDLLTNIGEQVGRVFERVRSEENIRREKEFSESVIQNSYNGILAFDKQYQITIWNPRMEQITGLNKAEVIGQNIFEVLPFMQYTGEVQMLERTLQGENLISEGQAYYIHQTNREGFYNGYYYPIHDPVGQIQGGLCFIREVSALKKVEQKLQEQQELLQNAISAAPVSFIIFDVEGVIRLSLGRNTLHRPGVTDVSGKSIFEIYRDVPQIAKNYRRALAGETFSSVVEVGGVSFDTRYTPLLDEEGEITGVVGVALDITETRRIVDALRKSEARFRAIFEDADLGIDLVDMQGNFVETNPALQEMLGYSAEELRQMNYAEITYPDDMQKSQVLFHELVSGRRNKYQLEKRYLHKDGSVIWARLDVSLFRSDDGSPLYAIGMVENFTSQKQLQAELAEVERRLIDSRESERLHLAQELHDGPLQDLLAISYQFSGLKDSIQDDNSLVQLNQSQAILHRVMQTLRNICGELRPPTLTPFGLEKAIRSHIAQIEELYPEMNYKLDLMSDGKELPERVRLALFRIYQQAVLNVIQHANANFTLIRFRFDDEQIELTVQDDGIGFEVPKRPVELVRGGHFGLVGAAERVLAIGGYLKIDSRPGFGTTLQAIVPRKDVEFAAPPTKGLAIITSQSD